MRLEPPPGCPPYAKECKEERIGVAIRNIVERDCRKIMGEYEKTMKKAPPKEIDAWIRERLTEPGGVTDVLVEQFVGMGGRAMMGEGVGGFVVGASCPFGGLALISKATFDLPWFTLLLNTFLNNALDSFPEEVEVVGRDPVPDVYTCWQLNFGRYCGDKLSPGLYYKLHMDKCNARVPSIGTAVGDYEGGGLWVAIPNGPDPQILTTKARGIMPGVIPGRILDQRNRWTCFSSGSTMHAVPSFNKDRVGMVAFSSKTALRLLPAEVEHLKALQFRLPRRGDSRFYPYIPEESKYTEREVALLSSPARKKHAVEMQQYRKELAAFNEAVARYHKEDASDRRALNKDKKNRRAAKLAVIKVQKKLGLKNLPKRTKTVNEVVAQNLCELAFEASQLKGIMDGEPALCVAGITDALHTSWREAARKCRWHSMEQGSIVTKKRTRKERKNAEMKQWRKKLSAKR